MNFQRFQDFNLNSNTPTNINNEKNKNPNKYNPNKYNSIHISNINRIPPRPRMSNNR